RPLGLAPAQFAVLLELWAGDGLTQKELVERLDVEQATMANTLARMVRDGLVERRPLPGDRRAQTVHLTARGQALEAPATQAATATNDAALADLNLAERLQFLKLMRRVIATLRDRR
ncbi:MAG: MarR family transcriptional regulator, partial [Rhodospirillaceae bacterium]|nr:MarR family transcriptional regulator [Rhodospirillaceae bacterium]